mmetsp:Transcript_11063/g.20454  ORF Transcript_11063/g.20454 Transcript_11063/m.20454 type:complete len:300 (-) Transcript_11063:131-1030(-)
MCDSDLAASECMFVPMDSNRAINEKVVNERVTANIEYFKQFQRFKDFGEIKVLVLRSDPKRYFHVLDGHHRCETMERLRAEGHPIWFQLCVKVVDSPEEAQRELAHIQNCYPSDPRCYFPTQKMTLIATECLRRAQAQYSPEIWKDVAITSHMGTRARDPIRPFLTDFLFFGLLQDSGLLEHSETADQVLKVLDIVNQYLGELADRNELKKLGAGTSQFMVDKARSKDKKFKDCYLGFFRLNKLKWAQVQHLSGVPKYLPKTPAYTGSDAPIEEDDEDIDENKPAKKRKTSMRRKSNVI